MILKRLFLATTAIASMLLAATPAMAAGPLNWTDLSARLNVRKDRPVWAVAYAAPYWYLTDGHDVNHGGHIWRTDGQWTKDITLEVKAMGLNRVDEIVGDGVTVSFVQRVDAGLVEVVNLHPMLGSYDAKARVATTSVLRNPLPTLTFSYAQGLCTIAEVKDGRTQTLYVGYDVCVQDTAPLAAWDGKAWLILAKNKILYRFEGGVMTNLGRVRDYFTSMASDGKGTTMFGGALSTISNTHPSTPLLAKLVKVTEADFTAVTTATESVATADTAYWAWTAPTVSSLNRNQSTMFSIGAWNGDGLKSIELTANGNTLKTCTNTTTTQNCSVEVKGADYQTGASIELKGLITDAKNNQTWTKPTILAMTDGNLNTVAGLVTDEANLWVTNELEPAGVTNVSHYGSAILRVNAKAKDGLHRVEIWGNGKLINQCFFNDVYVVQPCDFTIKGTDFTQGTSLSVNARVLDKNGKEAWGGLRTILMADSMQQGLANSIVSTWSTPEVNVITPNQSVTFHVSATDAEGVAKIEIYTNDAVKQTCSFPTSYGSRECSLLMSATDVSLGSTVVVKAKITDQLGNVTWSIPKSYSVNSTGIALSSMNQTVNAFTLSSTADAAWASTLTIDAIANQVMGVDRIEIILNNMLAKTCSNLTAGGSFRDVPVKGAVKIWNASTVSRFLAKATVISTADGRNYYTLQDVTVNANGTELVGVLSSTVGQGNVLAIGTPLAIQGLDSSLQPLVYAQAVDGFTGGNEFVSQVDATCSVTASNLTNDISYRADMYTKNGSLVWSNGKTIRKN